MNEDWRAVWRQLEAEMTQDDNDAQRLQQRAQVYAKALIPDDDLSDDESYHVLCFALGQEQYALDVTLVRSVRSLGQMTRVPSMPAYYVGIINLRGQMVTVFDLRRWYGNPVSDAPTQQPKEVIIMESQGLQLALLADRIEQVTRIPHAHITPLDLQAARGVTPQKRIVLDMDALCADERLIVGHRDE
jgi:purine-binding chemotaxis protein CheW